MRNGQRYAFPTGVSDESGGGAWAARVAAGVVEMTPGVRSFVLGFVFGVVACMGFITYYGDLGGNWLIGVGERMRTVAQTQAQARAR